jgi:hypothetical protein
MRRLDLMRKNRSLPDFIQDTIQNIEELVYRSNKIFNSQF